MELFHADVAISSAFKGLPSVFDLTAPLDGVPPTWRIKSLSRRCVGGVSKRRAQAKHGSHSGRDHGSNVGIRASIGKRQIRRMPQKDTIFVRTAGKQALVASRVLRRVSPARVRKWDRHRFAIESSYRQMHRARVCTCMRCPKLRFLFFALALILRSVCVWVWLHYFNFADERGELVSLRLELLRFRRMLEWRACIESDELHVGPPLSSGVRLRRNLKLLSFKKARDRCTVFLT